MMRHSLTLACGILVALGACRLADAAPIAVINPGGEEYPTGPNTLINPGGVAPLETTGWNSTLAGTTGEEGVEAINNNAASGVMRLAFGAVNGTPGVDDDTNLAADFVLYQETGSVIQALDTITMNWAGRAFFQFNAGTDFQTSLFGYLDGDDNLVMEDTLQHASVVSGVWTPTSHSYQVPAGSPLIGENLVIGFFIDTPSQELGGFTAIDDVTLDVTPIPEPASWAICLIGSVGLACRRSRRRSWSA